MSLYEFLEDYCDKKLIIDVYNIADDTVVFEGILVRDFYRKLKQESFDDVWEFEDFEGIEPPISKKSAFTLLCQ